MATLDDQGRAIKESRQRLLRRHVDLAWSIYDLLGVMSSHVPRNGKRKPHVQSNP